MKKAELPKNETERLQKLEEYNILDTLSEKEYEGIAKLASIIANTPISLISLIDKERQWFKSRVGLDVSETHRDYAFCAHAILEPKKIFQVPNAILDDRFVDNPLVTGDPNIRFYAGAPLVTSDNFSLGTLCVIDRVPRELTPEQEEGLSLLASQVIALLEERILLQKIQEQEQKIQSQFSELEFLYNSANCGYHALDANGTFLRINDLELEWLGETRENILNKRNFQDFIPENYFHFFKHSFERMKAEGKIDGVEATIIGANGKHIQISVNARAIYDENGNFLMSNATLIDITEKKALQLELEKSISLSFKKSEELQDQLKMAARIQKMILPIKSPLPRIRFFYKPLDEIGGALRRRHVNHVEFLDDLLFVAFAVGGFERGRFAGAVDRHQVVIERRFDAVAGGHLGQGLGKKRNAEHGGAGIAEFDGEFIQNPFAAKAVGGQIHDFLRRAGAFDRHGRLREQRGARLGGSYAFPGVFAGIRGIIAADVVFAEGFLKPLDFVPIQLQAGANDQVIVSDHVAGAKRDAVLLRLEGFGVVLDPVHFGMDQIGFVAGGLF